MTIVLNNRQAMYLQMLLDLTCPDRGLMDLSDVQDNLIAEGFSVDEQDAHAEAIYNLLMEAE